MLELKVHDGDREVVLQFEHSLLSLSKWESKHKKAFLGDSAKKPSELIEYFECMLLPPENDPKLVYILSPQQLDDLAGYINDSQTASSVPQETEKKFAQETVTSELIYYWLSAMKIPFQPVETWHLNRAMMLIQITNFKNQPEKKRSPHQVMKDWRADNERQKKILGIKD